MKLSAEKIQSNWIEFNTNIETYITGDRKQKLLDFYQKYEDRIILMPAAQERIPLRIPRWVCRSR